MSSVITDPEVRAFIERTESFYPPGSNTATVAQQRSLYDRMCAAFRQPRPVGLAVQDSVLHGGAGLISVRRYWPRDPGPVRVVYFHGGGFVVGGLDSHDDVCAEIAARCGAEVVAVDYRLCPEHKHPASYDDAMAAVVEFADRPLVLMGDSAGANLVAAVALHTKAELAGQVLIYPGLGGERLRLAAYTEHAHAPLLEASDITAYRDLRAGTPEDAFHPSFSPLLAKGFTGAPPCFVSAAEVDPLRDDGLAYVEKLEEAGIAGEVVIEDQLPHGFLRARHMSARAGAAFDRICAAVTRFAGG
ncbi:MAG: alpha/beta hydrolase [Pseudomonadota bacterium]